MQLSTLLVILSIGFISAISAHAEETNGVTFIESNHADCASDNSKMISIKNTSGNQSLEVWLDRWFMDVQTADHTKHLLTTDDNTHDLGCSVTRRGEKQQWTIYSVKPLEAGL
jgi:hypothetical protein